MRTEKCNSKFIIESNSQHPSSPSPVRNHLVCVIFDEILDLLRATLVLAQEPALGPFPVFSFGALVLPPSLNVEREEPTLLFTNDDDGFLGRKRPSDLLEAESVADVSRK